MPIIVNLNTEKMNLFSKIDKNLDHDLISPIKTFSLGN